MDPIDGSVWFRSWLRQGLVELDMLTMARNGLVKPVDISPKAAVRSDNSCVYI